MKNKKLATVIISFLVIVSLIGVLSSLLGFRLAKKNGATATEPDQLIGFLITAEDLNLLDIDAVMEDNIDDIISGKEIVLDNNDLNAYQCRLYATVKKETYTDEETGATREFDDYIFEGIDGIRFFITKNDGYTLNAFDEGIFDSSLSIGASDTCNESISIEGTIYTLPGKPFDTQLNDDSVNENDEGMIEMVPSEFSILYINSVYQCADGRIYAVPGNLNVSLQGIEITVSQEEKVSKNGGSSNQEYTFSGTLTMKPQYPADSITIIQMNRNNEVLSRDEYIPGNLPETLIPQKDADYLIVETNYNETDGGIRTERSIVNNTEESLVTIYYPEKSKWAVGQSTMLEWTD